MRVALLIVLLLIPAGIAQVQVLEDSGTDASATVAGTAVPAVNTAGFDLVGLWVDEDANDFTFTLQVADIDPTNPTPNDAGIIDVDFNHADQGFRLRLARDTLTGNNQFYGQFLTYDAGRGSYVYGENLQPTINGGDETAVFEIPRDWLIDGNGTAPTAGRDLDYFRAFARNGNPLNANFGPSALQIRDAMPDSGYGTVPYVVALGLTQSGHAHLSSAVPVRASNGEKGTFVFYVTASNLRGEEDRFDLSISEVPKDWEVTLPGASIRLGANQTRAFPVLVAVPFAHQHGVFENFQLSMTSQSTPASVGRVELGVRYLAVPQPAGHHDRLYLHSREVPTTGNILSVLIDDETVVPYFNTLETDDNDSGTAVPPFGGALSAGRRSFNWELYLEPGLQMGLDFDLNRTGEITAMFSAELGLYTATMNGYLVHQTGELVDGNLRNIKETVVASITPSSPKAINQGTSFDSIIRPTKASDLIPFNANSALVLYLNLTLEDSQQLLGGQTTDPMLTGGQFTLPLNEYRDSIDGVFNSLAGLKFVNNGDTERPVNPGETVLFNLTLTNAGAVDDVFSLRVNGTNGAWARALGDQEVFIPTGGSRPVVIAVTPPKDAPHLDIADLIVTAASKAEPSIQGNIRVVALVDDVLDHADESALIQDLEKGLKTEKKAPGAPIMVIMLALAALVATLRKQQR